MTLETLRRRADALRAEIGKRVQGQEEVVIRLAPEMVDLAHRLENILPLRRQQEQILL